MKNGLYHKVTGLPYNLLDRCVGTFKLAYSNHALRAAQDDRYGKIPLHSEIGIQLSHVIEAEIQNDVCVKIVVRRPMDSARDMVMALIPEPGLGRMFVKTVWINVTSDRHHTLDKSKYIKL